MKNKINKKKKVVSKEESYKDYSYVVEENGKCLLAFPMWPYSKDSFDVKIGRIAVLLNEEIFSSDVYIRKSKWVYENDSNPQELVYEFDKKYTKKIKDIEKAYILGKIKIEAGLMSELMVFLINYVGPTGWRKGLEVKKRVR